MGAAGRTQEVVPKADRGEGGRRVRDALLGRALDRTEAARSNYTINVPLRHPRRDYKPRLRFCSSLRPRESALRTDPESTLRPQF